MFALLEHHETAECCCSSDRKVCATQRGCERWGPGRPGLGSRQSGSENGSQALNHSNVSYLLAKAGKPWQGKGEQYLQKLTCTGFLRKRRTKGRAPERRRFWPWDQPVHPSTGVLSSGSAMARTHPCPQSGSCQDESSSWGGCRWAWGDREDLIRGSHSDSIVLLSVPQRILFQWTSTEVESYSQLKENNILKLTLSWQTPVLSLPKDEEIPNDSSTVPRANRLSLTFRPIYFFVHKSTSDRGKSLPFLPTIVFVEEKQLKEGLFTFLNKDQGKEELTVNRKLSQTKS